MDHDGDQNAGDAAMFHDMMESEEQTEFQGSPIRSRGDKMDVLVYNLIGGAFTATSVGLTLLLFKYKPESFIGSTFTMICLIVFFVSLKELLFGEPQKIYAHLKGQRDRRSRCP